MNSIRPDHTQSSCAGPCGHCSDCATHNDPATWCDCGKPLTFLGARARAENANDPDTCIVCGSEPTHLGLVVSIMDGATFEAVEWCSAKICQNDMALTLSDGRGIGVVKPVTS